MSDIQAEVVEARCSAGYCDYVTLARYESLIDSGDGVLEPADPLLCPRCESAIESVEGSII